MPKPHSDLSNTQVTPEPALEKRTRQQFTPEYKLRIIAKANACQHGELGALLTPTFQTRQPTAPRSGMGEFQLGSVRFATARKRADRACTVGCHQ